MKINYTEGAEFFTIPGEEETFRIHLLYDCERTGKTYIIYSDPEDEDEESAEVNMSCAYLTQQDGQWRLRMRMDRLDWAIIDEMTEAMNRALQEAPDGEEEEAVAAVLRNFEPSENPVLSPERQRELDAFERRLKGSTPEERLLNAIFGVTDDADSADA